MVKMLRRFISTLTTSALMLGFLAFVPGALAAPEVKFEPTPAPIYVKDGTNYEVNVKLTGYDQDLKVDFLVGKKGQALDLVGSDTFTKNETLKFTWDGNNAEAGDYGLKIVGDGVDLSHDFQVVDAPGIVFNPTPASTYFLGSGDYEVKVDLKGYKKDTDIQLLVGKKGGVLTPIQTKTYTSNGSYTFVWDGKLNGQQVTPGSYGLQVTGKDINNNSTNTLTHDFEVSNPIIVNEGGELSFVSTPPKEYVKGSGDYKFDVKITNLTTDTLVTATVKDPNSGIFIPKDNHTYTYNNETHSFYLNLSNYGVGTYQVQVSGKNKTDLSTNALAFTIDIVEPEGNCAGYKDVNADNQYCDALKWAKDEGIMTGQGNGENFDGASALNRAEVSKVSLMAYDQYDANANYCNNNKPFPDVELGIWYSNYICRAKAINMVTGYEAGDDAGKFVPTRSVSVIEMFAILLRPLNQNFPIGASYQGLANDQWYSGYAKYAKENLLYPGDTLSPFKEATRYEVAQFLYELHLDGKL